MNADDRELARLCGAFFGLAGVATGTYTIALSYTGHRASTASALLALSLVLFAAAAVSSRGGVA